MDVPAPLQLASLEEAHRRALETARVTPTLSARSLSERLGGAIAFKAENLQRTGSFKLRGALTKLAALDAPAGVVAGSAGNHGQSLAYAARVLGVPCDVFMPDTASVQKVESVQAFGGVVHRGFASVDDCIAAARTAAEERGLEFVHPFDDVEVVRGQAGVGLELVDQAPDLAQVVVSIGGGGLASGVALAVKQAARAGVRVVGVQAERCAPYPASLSAGAPVEAARFEPTIADGIAVKRPGGLTLELVGKWVDEVVTVPDEAIADAMVLLLERSKLVVEGAGAASLAALVCGAVAPAKSGTTVAVLSGGNVDSAVLAAIVRRAETGAGRRLRIRTLVPDHPGGLATLLGTVADAGGDVIGIEHVRDAIDMHVGETGVVMVLAVRGADHREALLAQLGEAGYEVTVG